MELAEYTKQLGDKLRGLVQSYLKTEERLSSTERCCIRLNQNELLLTCITRQKEINEIHFVEKKHFDDLPSLSLMLKGIADKYHLPETPITWLLAPDEYEINLIESMPVPKNELQTALAWRIRSLINYSIDEAVLEYFELPAKKGSSNAPLIGAVTAKKSHLKSMASMLKDCNLNLVTIDIPELALLKLAALYETDEKTTAFLYFYQNFVILNISSQKVLYFTRRIPVSPNTESVIDYEKLSLEILRYFDFFRSQWRLSSPTRIFAAAQSGDATLIAKAMTERLLNTVEPYTLNSTLTNTAEKKQIESDYLLDYGCLLRKEDSNATPGN